VPPRALKALLFLALLAGGWLALDWYRSDERQIRRQLGKLQRLAARSPAESDLAALAQAAEIAAFFVDPFRVVVEGEGIATSDRRELIAAIHRYRMRSPTLVVQIGEEQVFVDQAGAGANVFLVARFLADLGDLARDRPYRVRLHWSRHDSRWRVDAADVEAIR
jgi:sugar phosphate isomerase/epimerase